MLLCALVVSGCINLSFGQINTNVERISVHSYDRLSGHLEKLK